MKSTALVFTGMDKMKLKDMILPDIEPDEVLIETAYSCISPGTEMRCLSGKQIGAKFPFVPGYSLSGRIVATGAETGIQTGTPVFCTGTAKSDLSRTWGGHVQHAIKKANAVYPIPAGVNLFEAAATHIAAIPYHGMRLSQPMAHETVAVIGLGVIGQFSARLHALSGARVLGIDLTPNRVALLRGAGIDGVENIEMAHAALPNGADIVVDASGVNAVIPQAIDLARDVPWDDSLTPGTRYLVQGSYPGDFFIPYHAAFGKQVSFWLPRDAQPRDFCAVLDFLARGKLPMHDLITETAIPEDAPHIYSALQNRELLTAVFHWNA